MIKHQKQIFSAKEILIKKNCISETIHGTKKKFYYVMYVH
jgi:hypothetical protein